MWTKKLSLLLLFVLLPGLLFPQSSDLRITRSEYEALLNHISVLRNTINSLESRLESLETLLQEEQTASEMQIRQLQALRMQLASAQSELAIALESQARQEAILNSSDQELTALKTYLEGLTRDLTRQSSQTRFWRTTAIVASAVAAGLGVYTLTN